MSGRATLLYVDDEPINLQLFALYFRRKYDVKTAESGYAGLNILNKEPTISVVMSDMKMPGMSGIEFIKEAKSTFPSVYYFILTGYDITNEIALALKDKLIIKYFRKPFNVKEIESSIESLLM